MDAAAAAELATLAPSAGNELWTEALLRGPSGVLLLLGVYELHRIRSVLDRVTERISRLEARYYASVTQNRQSQTEP